MTTVEDYSELVDIINSRKHQISLFNKGTQKNVAIAMWEYIADNLDELSDEEIENGDIDSGYAAMENIKSKFAKKFEKDTGLVIDWKNYCILCEHFTRLSSRACEICPLKSCASYTENPFHTLVMYAMHSESRNAALAAIYKIIDTIEKEEFKG